MIFLPQSGKFDIIAYCTRINMEIPFGLMVRIPGFPLGGLGLVPGMGKFFYLICQFLVQ